MTPSHIGQYRIVRKIGAGGMGLVFLGEHTLLGRRAAIKTLLPTVAANHEIVERFFNEARATSAISDPGVIQVFDFGYHVDGTAYIVMELLEGEALSARIERLGKLTPADAVRIARQIAGSLSAAHAREIVHRDLKPENIFLVTDAEAQGGERTKILDFGICKVGSDDDTTLTQTGAMVGTPVYMSPEQCRGAGGVDHRSDIYAFGCLLFHMLTGRPPFLGDATGELIVAHLQEEPTAPSVHAPGLPPEVDALVLRCLAKAPGDRYQSMIELQQALGELYVELDAAAAADPVVPLVVKKQGVPLGQGFRSHYDGNFASRAAVVTRAGVTRAGVVRAAGSRASRARPPWMRVDATPPSTPLPNDLDDLDDLDLVRPPRSVLRAVLACVLVAGVALGLVATSYIIYSGDRREEAEEAAKEAAARAVATKAAADAAAAKPVEVEPAPVRVAPSAVAAGRASVVPERTLAAPAHAGSIDRAAPVKTEKTEKTETAETKNTEAKTETAAAEAVVPADDSDTDASQDDDETATAKSETSAPAERASRRTSSSVSDRARTRDKVRETKKPVAPARPRSPEPTPPAAAPAPASAASTARPASPPSEDLYDTR